MTEQWQQQSQGGFIGKIQKKYIFNQCLYTVTV